jgi:hypothetical protein
MDRTGTPWTQVDQEVSDGVTADMRMTHQEVAEAFSSHRFAEVVPKMAADVEWVSVGESTVRGRDAVIQACEAAAAEMGQLTPGSPRGTHAVRLVGRT